MKDERKLSILESALPLFAIYGKNDVSIDMICNKAKCSHGLVYHYFKNVEQNAIVLRVYAKFIMMLVYLLLFLNLFNII